MAAKNKKQELLSGVARGDTGSYSGSKHNSVAGQDARLANLATTPGEKVQSGATPEAVRSADK